MRIRNLWLVALLTVVPILNMTVINQTPARAAAPPTPARTFGLLAAGERSAVTAVTTGSNTTNNNGTEWYFRNDASMGFVAAGNTVNLNSCDVNDNPGATTRMCWHTSGGTIQGGYRAGTQFPGNDWTRYVYQANTLPTYYPSGPQTGVAEATVNDGGWTLCWAGGYADAGKSTSSLFGTDCTGTYLMYAASPAMGGLVTVSRNMQSVQNAPGENQNEDMRIYVGDNLDLGLVLNTDHSPISWTHYRVFVSNCIVATDCWPNNPADNPENWDSGTLVTDGTYTIPSGIEREQLYVYQADDDTGAALFNQNAVRLYVAHTPVVHEVSTCQELAAIGNNVSNYEYQDTFKLNQDIDCDGVDFGPGISFDGAFYGTFDGQNHTISNLTIDRPNDGPVGLFRYTNAATIKNVSLQNGSVVGSNEVGALVGEAYNTTITGVQSSLDVTASDSSGYYAGGLVGYYTVDGVPASMSNVSVSGDVTAAQGYTGGLIGFSEVYGYRSYDVELTVDKASYSGTVSATNSYAGGLIGYSYVENEDDGYSPARLRITNSYTKGSVISDNGQDVGGLIGFSEQNNDEYNSTAEVVISESYSVSDVVGEDAVGGFIGAPSMHYAGENLSILNSFTAGSVEARNGTAYALVGTEGYADNNAVFTDSYVFYDITRTGVNTRTYNDGIENGFGVNADNGQPDYFKNNTTNHPFDGGWDFTNTWATRQADYPCLRGQYGCQTADQVAFNSAEDNSAILLMVTGCNSIDQHSVNKESELESKDPAYSYAKGFVGFHATGCPVGGDATVRAIFTTELAPDAVTIRKYNPTNHAFTTLTAANSNLSVTRVILDGKNALAVLYTVTDNGPLDLDPAVGQIQDPVGVGSPVVSAPNTGLGPN